MSRLGLYGGSFDPIHYGHIKPVIEAADKLRLDRVLYLPTAHPPHKAAGSLAPAPHRFAMVELALVADERLRVSDLEMTAGPSFTIDTIEQMKRDEPDATLFLILGSDWLGRIETWHRWRDILDSVSLAVLERPGSGHDQALAQLSPETRQRLVGTGPSLVKNTPLDISATEIRRRIASGQAVPVEWVPPAVVEYARKHCLYS